MPRELPVLTKNRTPDAWRKALDVTEGYLLGVARLRSITTYAEVGQVVAMATGYRIQGHLYALLLGTVSERSHERHGVMLSAVVVNGETLTPGGGFAGLARELGLARPGESDSDLAARLLSQVWRKFSRR